MVSNNKDYDLIQNTIYKSQKCQKFRPWPKLKGRSFLWELVFKKILCSINAITHHCNRIFTEG